MIVRAKFSALKQGHWYEYLVRFALGGLATLVAGLVADIWGPAAGGLFLAFPAIFCASATLIEKHERERKEKRGCGAKSAGKTPQRLTQLARAWAASHSLYSAQSSGFSQKTLPWAPSLLQRSPGSVRQSCSGMCGAQCAFAEGETWNRTSLRPVRVARRTRLVTAARGTEGTGPMLPALRKGSPFRSCGWNARRCPL
jgi:hypothetical protein